MKKEVGRLVRLSIGLFAYAVGIVLTMPGTYRLQPMGCVPCRTVSPVFHEDR